MLGAPAITLGAPAVTLGSPAVTDDAPEVTDDAPAASVPESSTSLRTARSQVAPAPTGWRRFLCDSKVLARRLALQEPGDTRRFLEVVGTTGLLYTGRVSIQEEIREHRSASRTSLYQDGRVISKGIVAPLLAGGFLALGKISGTPSEAETAQILLESAFYSAALAGVGSFVLAAKRPEKGTAVRAFQTGGHGVSLDVALAGSVVAPLDRRHLRLHPEDGGLRRVFKLAVRGALYSALGLTALQRMDADKHWAPDVFLGAAAGLTTGYSLCAAHESRSPGESDRDPGPPQPRASPAVSFLPGGFLLRWSL